MKLQKVMLVDDEYMIVEGLKKLIPCEELDLEIVHTDENAESALAYLAENPVDIVITDISMPDMTGLEMIAELKKISPTTDCIVLSGYQDFDYARQAISLGVVDYLVKPVNRTALTDILAKLVDNRSQDNWSWAREFLAGHEESLKEVDVEKFQDQTFYISAGSIESQGAVSQFAATILGKNIYLDLWKEKPVGNFLSLEECHFTVEQVHELYKEIQQQLYYADTESQAADVSQDPYKLLSDKLTTGLFSEFVSLLPEVGELLKARKTPMYLTQQIFVQLMSEVYQHLNKFDTENFHTVVDAIHSYHTLEEMLGYVREEVNQLCQTHRYSAHVAAVLKIVSEDYQQELTLKMMSDRLFLNAVYLGQIIKKETGAPFSELLNRQRIKVSQQLLMTTDKSIEEICFQVGYNNVGYFYKIFKRFCNESPKVYREQLEARKK
ncbi:response regulator transcription factor [Streptococcus gallolyticus]|uniref:response regulator transcription factor n=1 Tax=Streptococcus hepaticus TaxID=3349163 RepID=UPI001C93D3E5|nr:response regulator transcription factor [Streptococcus gallolyticus]MBY5041255.1 response regulator transcription factor [Streptococcus gallolyticus]